MTPRRTRSTILFVFLGCLALNVIILASSRSSVWPEEFQATLLKILSIYSVPLAVILGGFFAQPRAGSTAPAGLCWAALILAVCWNMLLLWRTIAFSLVNVDSVSDLTKYLEAVSSAASFLIVGSLAFFFGKTAEEKEVASGDSKAPFSDGPDSSSSDTHRTEKGDASSTEGVE
jgi:hypothetical protein